MNPFKTRRIRKNLKKRQRQRKLWNGAGEKLKAERGLGAAAGLCLKKVTAQGRLDESQQTTDHEILVQADHLLEPLQNLFFKGGGLAFRGGFLPGILAQVKKLY